MATYNREKNTENARRYREKNKEKVRKAAREYQRRHREALLPKMREYSRSRYRNDPRLSLFEGAKRRAKLYNLPFSITLEDIIIPDTCPVLGIPIETGLPANSPQLPSLDRNIPDLGYMPGNVTVMSLRANSLKKNATLEEVTALYEWFTSNVHS